MQHDLTHIAEDKIWITLNESVEQCSLELGKGERAGSEGIIV
jgi:hypothetical protein